MPTTRREGDYRAQPHARRGWPARVAREPLLQFVLAGAALFAGYRSLHPASVRGDAAFRIEVTPDDLRQMSVGRLAQGRPAPTAEEMRHLVDTWLRDEILFREALALGLDTNDTIVKRRMVQKMDFLAEDLADLREPTRADLEVWFQTHADRFAEPPRATFRHLYFSPDRRGTQARAAADAARALLAGTAADAAEATQLADPFMFQDYYPERTPEQVARDFGPLFADALFQLAPGAWGGPIESGFGWHLVWLDTVVPGRVPLFEEVEPAVRQAWVDARRAEGKRRLYETMKARYVVVLPEDLTPPSIAAGIRLDGAGE